MAAKGRAYTITEMKAKNKRAGQYFFDPATLRAYRQKGGYSHKALYDPDSGRNFVRVRYKGASVWGNTVWYEFNPATGELKYLDDRRDSPKVPQRVRERV